MHEFFKNYLHTIQFLQNCQYIAANFELLQSAIYRRVDICKKNNTFSKHISLSLSFPLTNQLTKHLGLEENALSKS